jgi:AraC-like DNA-binding protein
MPIVIDTDQLPGKDRFERLQHALESLLVPVRLTMPLPSGSTLRLVAEDFGALTVARVTQTNAGSAEIVRSADLIRRSDPEICRLMVNLRGHNVMSQDGRLATLGVRELAVFDSSRPFRVHRLPRDGREHDFVMLSFPRSLLAVRPSVLRAVTGVVLGGDRALGGLVRGFALQLAQDAGKLAPADVGRVTANLVDLIDTWLAREVGTVALLPLQSSQQVLFLEVQAFILRNLQHHLLSPGSVAAAHHVSPRKLHALFHAHGATVAGWIRDRRLEACRRDLADRRLAETSVGAIGARWGFTEAAHFSRVFHRAFGASPRDYRRSCWL